MRDLYAVTFALGCSLGFGCSTGQSPDTPAGATAGAAGTTTMVQPATANGPVGQGAPGGAPAASNAGAGGAMSTRAQAGNGGPSHTLDAGPPSGTTPTDGGSAELDGAADAGAGGACDHACLIALASAYLDALVARDPSMLAVSPTLKFTENGQPMQLGQGLWQTASGMDESTRFDYADPMTGQVGAQLVMQENGSSPVLYQFRLKVVGHEITEIESMSVRQLDAANGFFNVAGMTPEPMWGQTVDPAMRMTRDQLKAEVDLYVDYLDGKTDSSGVHLDSNCARYENGVQTASGAAFALQNWSFDVVRRFLIFDEERGIVWGMFPFTHDPTTLVVGEAFKVVNGKIMMIRAVMANMPAQAWD